MSLEQRVRDLEINKTSNRQVFAYNDPNFKYRPKFNHQFLISESDITFFPGEWNKIVSNINLNPSVWQSITQSKSGKFQAACSDYIWISSSYGLDWTKVDNQQDWKSIAISDDGRYLTACVYQGKIWKSDDFGVSWSMIPGPINSSEREWVSVAMSGNGQYQTAVVNGHDIWKSSDYGETWENLNNEKDWTSVTMSENGKYQTICNSNGEILVSSDYLNTYSETSVACNFNFVSMSDSGQFQTAVEYQGYVYKSTDHGKTWTLINDKLNEVDRNWTCVSVCGIGKYQIATVETYQWISSDYGETWISAYFYNLQTRISLNGTGQFRISTNDENIYRCVAIPIVEMV